MTAEATRKNTIVLRFACYSEFPRWRIILVLVYQRLTQNVTDSIVRLTAITNLSRAVKKTFVSEMFRQSSHQCHCLLPSSDQQPEMISTSAMQVRRKYESTTRRRRIRDEFRKRYDRDAQLFTNSR